MQFPWDILREWSKKDRDRILGALDLSERTVEEIMLHRSSIEMINFNDEPKEILAQCMASNHTRLPVYKDEPENIIGVIHAKDLARSMYSNISGPDAALENLLVLDIGFCRHEAVLRTRHNGFGRANAPILRRHILP